MSCHTRYVCEVEEICRELFRIFQTWLWLESLESFELLPGEIVESESAPAPEAGAAAQGR